MKPGAQVRANAARIVAAVFAGQALDRAMEPIIAALPAKDQSLCRELCAGTLRFAPRLEGFLEQLLDRPMRKRDGDVRALALIGLYQLSETRIPPHAAVSATVDAVAALKKRQASGLLNALLRRFQRESDTLSPSLTPAAKAAHPPWLWNALKEAWPQQLETILIANNQRPPMTLRVNLAQTTREDCRRTLNDTGFTVQEGRLAPSALTLETPVAVGELPGFDSGLLSVQDEAAQLAAVLLAPQAGERILDACAAPGGKTLHLRELAPSIALTAMDSSAERLTRVAENLQRGGQQAELLVGDAAAPPQALADGGPYDGMLVDVPCSATGVIRRHPDIKVLRRPGDIQGFANQQSAILEGLWPHLKPGGRLLYVTCSILPAENGELLKAFLTRHTDARLQPLTVPGAEVLEVGSQLLPDAQGSDGLYFALISKAETSA